MKRSSGLKLRTLLAVLVLAVVAYYGFEIGGVYWRRYRLTEAVASQLAFVGQRTDESIRRGIREEIDGLGLPVEARRFRFVRDPQARSLQFSVSYTETVNLLFTTKEITITVDRQRRY